jgi:hypothetical protein
MLQAGASYERRTVVAIARVFDGKGWTTQQYDELIGRLVSQLGLQAGKPAPGVLFHWAAATDDGMRAVDVYESREAADQLVGESIGPIAGELGLPMPDISEYEVHNLLR